MSFIHSAMAGYFRARPGACQISAQIAGGDMVWHIAPDTAQWDNFNPADVNGFSTFKNKNSQQDYV